MTALGIILGMASPASDITNPEAWVPQWSFGQATKAGQRVGPDSAMTLSAYWACIRNISEDIAKVPLFVYKRLTPRGKDRLRNHPVTLLLHNRPNDRMTAFSFRETLTQWALGWGNGFAEIVRRNRDGQPLELVAIHPSRVMVDSAVKDRVVFIVRNDDTTQVRIPQADMLHIHGMGDGVLGYSVLRAAAESLGLALAAQTFGATFFGNGTALSGVVEHPARLKDAEALKRFRQSWQEIYAGPDNAHKIAILEEGAKYAKIGVPPEEAQFIETRYFQTEEITRWFRMPPHKIQHLLRSTDNNIEHQDIEYTTDALMSWYVRWEQEVHWKLLGGADELLAEHVVNALMRGDMAARSAYYSKQWGIGALSQNDIRELDNMNPIGPDGDVYYVPVNMQPTEVAVKGPQPKPQEATTQPMEPMNDEEEMPEKDRERRRQSAKVAMMPVFVAAAERAIRKECNAMERLFKKHPTPSDSCRTDVEKFYAGFVDDLVDGMLPPMVALAKLLAIDATSQAQVETIEGRLRIEAGTLGGQLLAMNETNICDAATPGDRMAVIDNITTTHPSLWAIGFSEEVENVYRQTIGR